MTRDPARIPRAVLPRRRFLARLVAGAAGLAWTWRAVPARADTQDTEPYLGSLLLVPYSFAPRGWALCNGQLLPINQNQALFSLLGTTYGGNGQTSFALPDLRGRVAIHMGQGPGMSNRTLGELGGSTTHTLGHAELPAHTHVARVSSAPGTAVAPAANLVPARGAAQIPQWAPSAGLLMNAAAIGSTGGSQPHTNMQPYLTLHYIIALQGIYPSF